MGMQCSLVTDCLMHTVHDCFVYSYNMSALPTQWAPGVLSLGVKWPGREADYSPPSSAKVERVEIYLHSPNTPPLRGA
jgi:hypothetical protein